MISTCPRCQKQVSTPPEVDPTALVRCPLCEAEYTLSEALSWTPPMLIPVTAGAECAMAVEPAQAESPEEHETELPNEAAMAAKQCGGAAPSTRRRRKPKSATQTLIEVVVGGLAGCLVGYYALAFYLGPDLPARGLPVLPLPGVSWLTSGEKEEFPKPGAKKPERAKGDGKSEPGSHNGEHKGNLAGEGKTP